MYLLDTDTIIYNLKGDEKVQQALRLHIKWSTEDKHYYSHGVVLRGL